MLKRLFFSIKEAIRHRKALKIYNQHTLLSVTHLTAPMLQAWGVKLLALDFDGVLSPHGEDLPSPEVQVWLNNLLKTWPQEAIVILTNNPKNVRMQAMQKIWPGIVFHLGPKKPYPDGLDALKKLYQLKAQEILLVDDRLLTGVLAAHLAGVQVRWIISPKVNLRKRPILESIFWILRKLEKQWIR